MKYHGDYIDKTYLIKVGGDRKVLSSAAHFTKMVRARHIHTSD